jgi:lactoylglutathione lyase
MSMEDAALPGEEPELLARVVLVGPDGHVAVTRLTSGHGPDLSTVDEVAKLALAARRAHGWVRLEEPSPALERLLELTGLLDQVGRDRMDCPSDDSRSCRTSYLPTGGEPMTTATPTIQISQIHTVGVPVADQDRALCFYVETLGFRPVRDVPMGPRRRWIEVAPPQGTTTIALVASSDGVPVGVETGIRLVSADVAGDHAALTAEGVDVGELLRMPGVPPMFDLRDPDGNRLVLVGEA